MDENSLSKEIIGAAIEVHKILGPGLLETAYQMCLEREFAIRGVAFEKEKSLSVAYKGIELDCGFRVDFIVQGLVVVELKAVERLLPIHEAQVLTYLKLLNLKLGLLLNFNVPLLKEGIKRIALCL
ncbi:MAG: GxxExxY protein [Candidatus Tritonobacter lacicola]|nr:GxxExxY protein [Candidatus Tritonobacter lacicola]